MKTSLPLCVCAAALALAACNDNRTDSNNVAPTQSGEAKDAAGDKTIAASLDQNGKFFQAARAVGLDATLAGPGPYTVLVPTDEAFAKVKIGSLNDPANGQNRAEVTRVLTYHILPGVVLLDDINKAIDAGGGKAVLATMGGETITATKEGDKIVFTDAGGGKATVSGGEQKLSNGAVYSVDGVLTPSSGGAAAGEQAQNSAG
jgi:uncharacterized surface protein with fasciclin (FAS1) repeats